MIDTTSGRIVLEQGASLAGVDVIADSGTALESEGLIDHVRVTVTGTGSTGALLHAGATLRNSIVTVTGPGATGVRIAATSPAAEFRGSTVVASGTGARPSMSREPEHNYGSLLAVDHDLLRLGMLAAACVLQRSERRAPAGRRCRSPPGPPAASRCRARARRSTPAWVP